MESNFVDYVRLHCGSGSGGAGSSSLRREKYVPKGGPDGGDGGRGGHIIIKASKDRWTLLHLRFTKHLYASNGLPGGKQGSFGANGEDVIIEVPVGTIAKSDDGEVLGEVLEDNESFILLNGGKGGRGNIHFKSSTNQTPRYAQKGMPGEQMNIVLELKVLADVGFVGFPNAGKSTLLSVITRAKPKIADYAFTTLTPNLGIVEHRDYKSFIVADIPGIIEGASTGKGIGFRFLKHIERNASLLFLIPADSEDHFNEYKILLNELGSYNIELLNKSRLVAISKSDMLDNELKNEIKNSFPSDIEIIFFSSFNKDSLIPLKDKIWDTINKSFNVD